MGSTKVKGRRLSDEAKIKEGVLSAFHSILIELGDLRLSISGLSFSSLGSEDSRSLEDPSLSKRFS